MITATIFEAKTNLSELVKKAQAGEEVVITSGREKTPVARLEAIQPVEKKRLGFLADPNFVLGDAFWEPLSDEEMGFGPGEEDPLLSTPDPAIRRGDR
ncbi:type II toxin-antitoxin system Phd/YefM family antitoxin [Paracidobacterium acidisoli]|uniref:Type II toxin-antitoxin system prevent-host-death family antitoxin n=1 Tax=Paracidobacterium acidisoli TaxID=2303751 RepID=A0A372IPE0_9BACT|nr:type II toxin-antitoxin system prevent-host-death family antitoxin [Paracidobacterium acidisoli]MBT9331139.1 type II toxin-antitoxin system prevent-host-death family antitoxin [Paracidobacterium acidisoli]